MYLGSLVGYVLFALQIAVLATTVYAFVHAAMQRPDAYTAVDKLTKPVWLAILGGGAVLGWIIGPPVGAAIAAFVGSFLGLAVYLNLVLRMFRSDVETWVRERAGAFFSKEAWETFAKRLTYAPGDATAEQMDEIADLADAPVPVRVSW